MDNPDTIFDTVEAAIKAINEGEMVVVVDDEDRENEGDLIMAASKATEEQVAFMVRHTSGILCAPLTDEIAARLKLDPMVSRNSAPHATAFTVSVDYTQGLSTGISASERANTVQALANNNAQGEDFVRPGHIFPLVGRRGGVLVRSGHTEAAIDLAAAAGCPPVGLLAEIVNDQGTVKRLQELLEFAQENDLKIISIADLISWRQRREKLVDRVGEFSVRTRIGPARGMSYRTRFEEAEHVALVFGDLEGMSVVPVRIHREKPIEDIFGPQSGHELRLIDSALDKLNELGGGVFILLRSGFAGVPLDQLDADTTLESKRANQWLEVGIGAQIVRDLGVRTIRIVAGREVDLVGIEGFGLSVDGTELLQP